MALNKRERTLATVTGGLLVVAVVWFGGIALIGPLKTLRQARSNLQEEQDQKKQQVDSATKALERLDEYRRRALPSDPEIARSLYKNWLLELTDDAGFDDTRVDPGEPRPHGDVYQLLPFTVNGLGTLDELTEFLYKFYSEGHLQKIRQLVVKPLEGSENLDLRITIEALCMPDAVRWSDDEKKDLPRADELSAEVSLWLADADLADYDVIADRNLFAPYEPPRPPVAQRPDPEPPRDPPPPSPPKFDPSKFAFVTGITEEDGAPLLWLTARTTNDKYKLAEGDTFEIGELQGTVVQIHQRAAEIEIDGERRFIPLGNSLHDWSDPPE